jgi:uncharacterized protein YdeI (YjbR/CyaY-like superfamily)
VGDPKASMSAPKKETIGFACCDDFEAWLDENHASSDGIWLKIAKKESGLRSVSYPEALDVALCFGWIDGQKDKFDERHWLQRFTPRRKKSIWSQINREKVAALITQKRMRPSGMTQIELAKADGRWDAAYAGQRTAQVPDDLAAALAKNKKAEKFFAALDSTNRYAILFRINNVKKAETRARKVAEFVAMMRDGKKLYERGPKK